MVAVELPKIPQDFQNILLDFFERILVQEVSDVAGKLAKTYEQKWTQQLKDAVANKKVGSEFLFCTITRIDQAANKLTLLFRFTDVDVPFVPQLKLALARAEVSIEPWINLTDSHKPIISATTLHDITSFAIEIDIKTERYQIGIGYAQDDNAETKSKQVLVAVLWRQPPSFYLFGILGKSDKGGLLIDVMGDSPFAIPLGPTGVALKGIGLLYGERFAPLLPGATPQNVMERLRALGPRKAKT